MKPFHAKFHVYHAIFYFFLMFVMPFFSKIHVCHAKIHAASCPATLFFHAKLCHATFFSCEIRAISCEFSEIRTNSCHSKFVPHANSCHANFTPHVSHVMPTSCLTFLHAASIFFMRLHAILGRKSCLSC